MNDTVEKKRATASEPKKDKQRGTWHFYVDGGLDANGKRQRVHRRGFRTKAEAQEELDRLRGQKREGTYKRPKRQTVRVYLTAWLATLPTEGRRPSTIDSYKRCLDYVIDVLGGRQLDSIQADDLNQLYASLLESGRRQREGGLKPRTVRYIAQVLSKALSDAVREGVLRTNVAEVARPPSAKSTKAPEQQWWTPDQVRSFLAFTADERLAPLFRLAAVTGMRRGEVCGLRWESVDLDGATIEVHDQLLVVRTKDAPNGGLVFSDRTKTDEGRRRADRPGNGCGAEGAPEASVSRAARDGCGLAGPARPRVHGGGREPVRPGIGRPGVQPPGGTLRSPASPVPRPPALARRDADRGRRGGPHDQQASRPSLDNVHDGQVRPLDAERGQPAAAAVATMVDGV